MDAAIATMLCDGAQCPQCMGVGGGFIMSIYNVTTKKVLAINAREIAPASATTEMFVKDPEKSVYGACADETRIISKIDRPCAYFSPPRSRTNARDLIRTVSIGFRISLILSKRFVSMLIEECYKTYRNKKFS